MMSGVEVGEGVKVWEGVSVGPKVGVGVGVRAGVAVLVRDSATFVEAGVKIKNTKTVSRTTFKDTIEKRTIRCRLSIRRIVVGEEEESKLGGCFII